jgi:DNA-binding NarL/FixJ family response regulator/putative methionine-R-sulfoxide reductase with GAF domain
MVLVVDDERFFREAISDVLERHGVPFAVAASGEEALDLAADRAIGVVVLDIELPGMNGLETFRHLRERRPELRVIILSAHTHQEYVLEALRLGAFDYLAKPLHEEELALAVRRARESFAVAAGFGRLRRRLEDLAARIQSLGGAAREEGSLPRQAAVEAVSELLGASRTSLMLLDETGTELRVAATHGGKLLPEAMSPVPLGEPVAGLVAARSEPLLVRDAGRDERLAGRGARAGYASASFALAPVAARGRLLGVLCATDRPGGTPFEDDDLAVLRILSAQVGELLAAPGAAPEGAAPDLEGRDAEAAPDASAELARVVCEAVTSEVEPTRLFEASLRRVGEALRAAPVSLFLVTQDGGRLAREAQWDGGLAADRAELAPGRGLCGSVFETGQIVATADPAADPRFDAAQDTPEDGAPRPLLCGPLRFRGKVLGVFRAFLEGREAPPAATGEVVSAALSAAVRNALLYRSLIESIDELARVRREGVAR